MSKKTRKCPNCGASVTEDMKYCRKCHAKLDSGGGQPAHRPGGRLFHSG